MLNFYYVQNFNNYEVIQLYEVHKLKDTKKIEKLERILQIFKYTCSLNKRLYIVHVSPKQYEDYRRWLNSQCA